MKRVLFIGHGASRTGAPIILLHFLRWLKQREPELQINLLLLKGGALVDDYREVANVYLHSGGPIRILFREIITRAKQRMRILRKPRLPKGLSFDDKYDVVLGNTIVSLNHLKYFKQTGSQTICWVHELASVVNEYLSLQQFKELCLHVDVFIAGSNAVKRNLEKSVTAHEIHTVYEFSQFRTDVEVDPSHLRSELAVPPGAFVVGGSGSVEPRKGPDLFIEIAQRLTKKFPDIYFIWVGGRSHSRPWHFYQAKRRIVALGLGDRVTITGYQKEPLPYYAAFDLFALTSREDPFPVVCLIAAGLGKPIICFEDAGGMPEFVENDAGAAVPYGDIDAFCEKIEYYYNDRKELEKAGTTAREKIASRFSPKTSCQKVFEILNDASRSEDGYPDAV